MPSGTGARYSGSSNHGKNSGTKATVPSTAASQKRLKALKPFGVLSITTAVSGSSGTACSSASNVSSICGQKAASEACTFVSVSLRPMPPPLAVTQRIELISPGFRSFSAASFVGFSNTISCALLFFRIGLSAAGRLS